MDNFIGIYENFFSREECEYTINLYEDLVSRGFGYTRKLEGAAKTSKSDLSVTTNFINKWDLESKSLHGFDELFTNRFWDYAYQDYSKEYAVLKEMAEHGIYTNKIQKTVPGQGYHVWHCETDKKQFSGRVLAWILYLNDVEEGGETEFLYYHQRIKPVAGTLILFPAYFTHTHRGNGPISNDKYISTGWVEF
jgi:hypothetical protein